MNSMEIARLILDKPTLPSNSISIMQCHVHYTHSYFNLRQIVSVHRENVLFQIKSTNDYLTESLTHDVRCINLILHIGDSRCCKGFCLYQQNSVILFAMQHRLLRRRRRGRGGRLGKEKQKVERTTRKKKVEVNNTTNLL